MSRRMAFLLTPLLLLSLIGAGCGGGGDDAPSASTSPAATSSGDAAVILSSIKPVAQQGPQKIALNLAVKLDGTLKDPTVGALLGSGPIALNLSGPVDATAKAADLAFDAKAGKINLAGGLRVVGDKAFLQLADKWYELPADAFTTTTSGSTGSVDVAKALEALGDPSALIKNATVVGSEVIEGIDTDHVAGDVDTAELVKAISRVAATVDTSSSPIDASQISEATAKLEEFVKNAKVELWIGKEDKQVHRFKVNLDAVLDADTKASSGLNGFNLDVALTSTPTDSPNVEAPSGALPASQLQTDIGPIILAGLGGATTTP
jgi:hypothetical protein